MIDRLTEGARRVLDLAHEEASRFGHRYVGCEHVVLGVLRDGTSRAAQVLRARGMEPDAAWVELGRLADRGVVASPAPSDAELLGTLGIDLDAVRQRTERTFGSRAVAQATREATRARRRGVGRVAWTPLCGPPFLAKRAVGLASRQARALGGVMIGPEVLLLGVLDDITEPWPRCMSNRWRRRLGFVAACLAVFAVVAVWVSWSMPSARLPGKTPVTVTLVPGGTRPAGLTVTDLRDVGQLQARFNADQGHPRLVLALAPA